MNIDLVNPLYAASWSCLMNHSGGASIQIVDFILNYLFLSNFQYPKDLLNVITNLNWLLLKCKYLSFVFQSKLYSHLKQRYL